MWYLGERVAIIVTVTFLRDFCSGLKPVKMPISIIDMLVFPLSIYLQNK